MKTELDLASQAIQTLPIVKTIFNWIKNTFFFKKMFDVEIGSSLDVKYGEAIIAKIYNFTDQKILIKKIYIVYQKNCWTITPNEKNKYIYPKEENIFEIRASEIVPEFYYLWNDCYIYYINESHKLYNVKIKCKRSRNKEKYIEKHKLLNQRDFNTEKYNAMHTICRTCEIPIRNINRKTETIYLSNNTKYVLTFWCNKKYLCYGTIKEQCQNKYIFLAERLLLFQDGKNYSALYIDNWRINDVEKISEQIKQYLHQDIVFNIQHVKE